MASPADDEIAVEGMDKTSVHIISKETDETHRQDNVVDWDGPDDPQNPRNWPRNKKWTTVVLVSAITFNQAMSSTVFAPCVPQAMRDFGSSSQAIATLLVSIYPIGLAVGPLFLSPLSEMYGRSPIMHGANFLFLVATILCAISINIPMLLVFRFLLGVSTVSLGGGYVADLMEPGQRQRAINVWTAGPLLAPFIGPIAGGFISLESSWRWTFGMVAITGAVAVIGSFVLLRETYAPRLLELKTRRLRTQTGNSLLKSRYDQGHDVCQLLRVSIFRPMEILARSPMLGLVSLFLAVAYSYMYLLFTTFTDVFAGTYGFNTGQVGLCYLGMGIGCLLGQYALDFSMKSYAKRQLARNRERQPEDQLPPLIVGGVMLAAGLVWYGWSLEYKVHWIVPVLGTGVCGFAISLFFLAVQTYIVEVYTIYAASALAVNTAIRCVFGLTVPLAGPSLYKTLGLGWGNSLLALLALAMAPASFWLLRCSEQIRKNSKFYLDK